jgi:Methyltransferase domain
MTMAVHLFVPASIRRFSFESLPPGPSLRHAALEYDLAAAVRPRLLVDLGTGDATSFFAFCQSMSDHTIDGTCYAIDTWEGKDPEAADSFEAVNGQARRRFPGITYVVRMAPADARRHFDEETVDLLRIDGSRADVVAGADVAAWLRRVRSGGLVLWHGAADNPSLWSLIASACRHFVFSEGRGGLGVARKDGPEPDAELLRLLFSENEGLDLERFYRHAYEHMEYARIIEKAFKKKP